MINCTFENGHSASLRHGVVDTIVLKDDKILLVKRTGALLEGGKWGLTGGFVDRDETLEQAAAREVKEETGWDVAVQTLLRVNSSPDRPKEDRQNISFVFIANAIAKTGESDNESDDVQWFALDSLPAADEMAFDHMESISLYVKSKRESMSLPVLN